MQHVVLHLAQGNYSEIARGNYFRNSEQQRLRIVSSNYSQSSLRNSLLRRVSFDGAHERLMRTVRATAGAVYPGSFPGRPFPTCQAIFEHGRTGLIEGASSALGVSFRRRNQDGKAIEWHVYYAHTGRTCNQSVGRRGRASTKLRARPMHTSSSRWASTPRRSRALILQKKGCKQMMGCPNEMGSP